MVKRQFPNPKELLGLMKFKKPDLNGKRRRLNGALTIYDLQAIAKRRTPKAAFDYTDGAAEGELRWRWPPESARGLRSRCSSSPSSCAAFCTRSRTSSLGVFFSLSPNAMFS